MKARVGAIGLAVAALVTASTVGANAQAGGPPVSGVVVAIASSEAGELESFKITDAAGATHEFRVQGGASPTAYGLENQAGDRWTSDQAKDPVEAARRLLDHQVRFAPVTVTARDEVAVTVVEAESGKLETNLGYLFAIYTVTWVAFFGYVFLLGRRQRDLQREIDRLKSAATVDGNKQARP